MTERISTRSAELLATQRVAHLATADQYARPHIVPIVFVFEDMTVYTPIDGKRKSVDDWHDLRRVRNVEANGRASVLVDHYEEVWSRCAWVRLDGVAELLEKGDEHHRAIALLSAKYKQYERMPLRDAPVIRVRVEHASQWHG